MVVFSSSSHKRIICTSSWVTFWVRYGPIFLILNVGLGWLRKPVIHFWRGWTLIAYILGFFCTHRMCFLFNVQTPEVHNSQQFLRFLLFRCSGSVNSQAHVCVCVYMFSKAYHIIKCIMLRHLHLRFISVMLRCFFFARVLVRYRISVGCCT